MYKANKVVAALIFAGGVLVAAIPGDGAPRRAGLRVRKSPATGLATFVTAADGGVITIEQRGIQTPPKAIDFFAVYGGLFGVTDPGTQLVEEKSRIDDLGLAHTTFLQVHKGVSVFSGVLKVHQNGDGAVVVANGDFYPIDNRLDTIPSLAHERAVDLAIQEIEVGDPAVEHSELVIVDPGWYGDPPLGTHLAYHIILTDLSVPVREAFFVDAHDGAILDQWTLLQTARDRRVYDDSQVDTPLVRGEGDPATGDYETDAAYDYSGDVYDFLFRGFGRDGVDGSGGPMHATVHSQRFSCPNAWGGTGGTTYCDGIVTDDSVAHEFAHGLTGWTAQLIYQNQSGQLNESFSDVFGELVDLYNGNVGFPGPPSGPPYWPAHPTGPGTDLPNTLRTDECASGARMEVNAPAGIAGVYRVSSAFFGPALTETGITGNLVPAIPSRACLGDMPFSNPGAISGNIALIDGGYCLSAEKVKNAQDVGAVAVIVVNRVEGPPPALVGEDATITIPSIGITLGDGEILKSTLASETVNVTLAANSASIGVRWLVSEDAWGFGGAIRDMWWPSCMGDPDHANHPYQLCYPGDNGGVHSGSGIPNHAFAIVTDGKTYNGQTVSAIGPIKAAAVWYRALTVYLGPASDFRDAYYALNQSALDLVGTYVIDPRDGGSSVLFTPADASEVDKALLAVEMNTDGACGASSNVLDSNPPPICLNRVTAYTNNFESGNDGWTVFNTSPPTPYDWVQLSEGLPLDRPGTVWFAEDLIGGSCDTQDESAVHHLLSPSIALPGSLNAPTLAFTHYVSTEPGYDGGNVKISVNGGGWTTIPGNAFRYNPYNSDLIGTNPLGGEPGWSSSGGGWGTSLIDLSGFVSGGETVQFRFDFGKDGCGGIDGWYLDDFEVYTCRIPVTKFLQEPMPNGENVPSNIDLSDDNPSIVVADDFVSDGRPITAVRWWGSDIEEIASEPVLYASDGAGNNLGIVDPDTGQFTVIGPFGASPITEIEWSPDGSTLYGTSGGGWSNIYTIDHNSGAILSTVFAWGILLPGLEFDSEGNLLGFDALTGDLVVVNPITGSPSPIGNTSYYAPIGGLAFDSDFATLYGIGSGGQVPPDLLRIDPFTGASTLIAATTMLDSASSLEFTADGRLVTAGHDNVLYEINPVTGAATAVGPLVNSTRVSGLSLRPVAEEVPPDGWLISFHEPLAPAQPAHVPLALYFCDDRFVETTDTVIPACDAHVVREYLVDLMDCCLLHTAEDSRSQEVPGQLVAFFEEEGYAYDIDIQAVVGGKYERDWSGECVLVPTGTSAEGHFWGWHSTSVDSGLRDALTGPVDFHEPDWLYGTWNYVVPTCSTDHSMAFELLAVEAVDLDCNENGILDECDLDCDALAGDCNVPGCGLSSDENDNGSPDECDCYPSLTPEPDLLVLPMDPISQKIRYLSFRVGEAGRSQAIRVTFTNVPSPYDHWNDTQLWVQEPQVYCENAGIAQEDPCPVAVGGLPSIEFWGAQLGCDPYFADWTQYDTVHVWNEGVIPGGVYLVKALDSTCSPGLEENYSVGLVLTQSTWADLVQDCTTTPCKPPDGSTGIVDVTAILDKWKNLPGNVQKVRADIEGSPAGDHRVPDQSINITDVTYCLGAFLGDTYPGPGFPPPSPPPVCP